MTKPIIATLAGHSALEIFSGAKREGFNTLAIVVSGREKTYTKYYRHLVDEFIILTSFAELTSEKIIERLKKKNIIFIPHRYLQVYCDLNKFEKDFIVPVFGNKFLLKYEEREGNVNQYQILKQARVEYPQQFKRPEDIDRLAIVKVRERQRNYERAFFFADSLKEFIKKAKKLKDSRVITADDLKQAVIEEYQVGVQVNFNFFYSPLNEKLELLGTDTRRQTNIDGLTRIPVNEQMEYLKYARPSYIESGHIAVTVKESLLEKAYELAEKIVCGCQKMELPIIGPFALQTVITAGPPKEKIMIFDLSLRIPGSPGTANTPYSGYLFGQALSFGDRIALEITKALKLKSLKKIIT